MRDAKPDDDVHICSVLSQNAGLGDRIAGRFKGTGTNFLLLRDTDIKLIDTAGVLHVSPVTPPHLKQGLGNLP